MSRPRSIPASRRARWWVRRLAGLAALWTLGPPVAATRALHATQAAGHFKVEVELVLVAVSVRDREGNPVTHLQRSDFTITEDGAQQEIAHFEEEDAPAAIVLLLDASSSMQGAPLKAARRDALALVERAQPDSELALMVFDRHPRLLQGLTRDRARIRAAIERLEAGGGTALYDAMTRAIELVQSAGASRKIVVVFSDGVDHDSAGRFAALAGRIESSEVVIFALGEYSELERKLFLTGAQYYKEPALEANLNPAWVLTSLAELSGGAAFFPAPGRPLGPAWERIAREIQHQYVLGYPPPRSGPPGFHRIEVRAASAAHPGPLRVRARRGYVDRDAAS